MEIKTQPFNKVHMPTIERHIKALKEASAYLMGVASDAAIEHPDSQWIQIGMEGAKIITHGRMVLEKLKKVNIDGQIASPISKFTVRVEKHS